MQTSWKTFTYQFQAESTVIQTKRPAFEMLQQEIKGLTSNSIDICDALRDLVPFVQFKKSEKHPWRSVTIICFY